MVLQFSGQKIICGSLAAFVFVVAGSAQPLGAGNAKSGSQVLQLVADLPLPGLAVRVDVVAVENAKSSDSVSHDLEYFTCQRRGKHE